MRKITLFLALIVCSSAIYAQSSRTARQHDKVVNQARFTSPISPAAVIFTDNMDGDNSISGLNARGYTTYFRGSGNPGLLPEWIQGDPLSYVAFNGPDSGYVGSSYNSVENNDDLDNWLVLPPLNVAAGDSFSFYVNAPAGSPFADSARVMYNPSGATLPEDSNWIQLDNFYAGNSGNWMLKAYEIPITSATGVLAIRHSLVDAGPAGTNSDFLGIDQIDVFSSTLPGSFDTCDYAVSINSSFGGVYNVVNTVGPFDNSSATTDALDPMMGWACFGEPDGSGTGPELNNTVWFTFTGDGNDYFVESGTCTGVTNYIDDGDTQFALYSGTCGSLSPVLCNEDGPSATATTYPAGFTFPTTPGMTYYLMVDGFSFQGAVATGEFCLNITNMTQPPVGSFDTCAFAVDITSSFGGAIGTVNTIGPFDNSTATTDTTDPLTGWECYGEPDGSATSPELNNTVWFSFVGDGNNYFVESGTCAGVTNYIDDGDTQFSLYSGTCGNLTALKCNEDGPSATATTYPAGFTFGTQAGVTYYLMVDGFSFQGAVSTGEFCLLISQVASVACTDPSISTGSQTQNKLNLCNGDTLIVSTAGAITPNTGDFYGISWVITSADITGNTDPLNDPSLLASYSFTSPAPAVSTRQFVNNGTATFIVPGNTYYWTPVVFGNAVQASANAPVFLSDLTLDPTCTTTGTSMQVNVLLPNDPLCIVGVTENLPGKNSSMVAYPSPVQDVLHVDFISNVTEKAVVEITDYTGRVVLSHSGAITTGLNSVTIDVKSLASGTYFVSLKGDAARTVKFIK